MSRFEDLMDGQGRIRLLRKSADTSMMANYYLSVCRGWQIFQFGLTPRVEQGVKWWEYDMGFRPVPQTHFAEADFDTMLAALEPYELVTEADEPLKVEAR